jgi:hypothetical protein
LPKPKTARANPARRLMFIRQCHVYISVFVAPTLLFFALTGALQTFRIPDLKQAPVVLQKLARLHKDDVFAVKPARPKRQEGAKPGGQAKPPQTAEPAPAPSTERLKWFFAIASVAVAVTTLLGLWMALAYHKRKALMWVVLIAGAAAPVLLLLL